MNWKCINCFKWWASSHDVTARKRRKRDWSFTALAAARQLRQATRRECNEGGKRREKKSQHRESRSTIVEHTRNGSNRYCKFSNRTLKFCVFSFFPFHLFILYFSHFITSFFSLRQCVVLREPSHALRYDGLQFLSILETRRHNKNLL